MEGNCGIVRMVNDKSLVVLFTDMGVELELAKGWFAAFPHSGTLVPNWPEFRDVNEYVAAGPTMVKPSTSMPAIPYYNMQNTVCDEPLDDNIVCVTKEKD